VVKLA
jgi:hypothetical protein